MHRFKEMEDPAMAARLAALAVDRENARRALDEAIAAGDRTAALVAREALDYAASAAAKLGHLGERRAKKRSPVEP